MNKSKINLALAGYANVGKSVIFNLLTGLHQHIGNWPGKTIERAEGTLFYNGHTIDVLDLPGIYSLSTYSLEELITREYIVSSKPDFIANVIDATNLERNLILTLQLLELEKPMVLVLNMINLLKPKGISIDFNRLKKILGVPVIPSVAIHGKGLTETLDSGLDLIEKNTPLPKKLKYGKEVETCIEEIISLLQKTNLTYPKRFTAIKLLEKDGKIEKEIKQKHPKILEKAKELRETLEKIHGHDSSIVIADERCILVSKITREVMSVTKPQKTTINEKIEAITGHKFFAYPIMAAILGVIFFTIFQGGSFVSSFLMQFSVWLNAIFHQTFGESLWATLAWSGIASFLALIEIAIPYIAPFYFFLFALEDLGYLARVAYLMDNIMHKLGIHGKACIPMMIGFGCNVPACLACRIMETKRERFITGLLTMFIPCSAITVIIAGLVGKFVGIGWAFGLYAINFLIIFIIGKIASKIVPGEPAELIMEMPSYKLPSLKTISLQTWFKLKEFLFIAGPIVIISGVIIDGAYAANILTPINNILAPITSKWLGLPPITGILLIFGILRKELILVMLATLLGTTNFALDLTKAQMLILALVSMLYIPCVATIAALYKEFGWKKALFIAALKIAIAILLGGLIFRLLNFFNL